MLLSDYYDVSHVRTKGELEQQLERFTRALGFNTYSVMAVQDRREAPSEFFTVHKAPDGYVGYDDMAACKRDPILQHCKRSSLPFLWNRETYVQQGKADMWEHQAKFGYHCGIGVALHLPEGRHLFIGLDRDQPLPNDGNELRRMVADLQLFLVHAQEASERVLIKGPAMSQVPELSPRELEALRWTMEGKTAWEVGHILGISERTAVLHVTNATRKLGCVNKRHAVVKALRNGLIA